MSATDQHARPGVVVGLGAMGSNHLRVASRLDGSDVVAVVDPDPDRRANAIASYPTVAAYATLDEAIAAHDLTWACLAVPVGLIPELAELALRSGIHLLVEKPTAPSVPQAQKMVTEAASLGLVLAVGHIERCNPAVVALKAKLEEGQIGRVLQMNARRLSPYPNRQGSQGVALDLSTHDIDVMRFISGDEVMRVQAETASFLGGPPEHEDAVAATLRFDQGVVGLVETNWMSPTKVRQLTVFGERGMFTVDYLTQDLILHEYPANAATEWDHLAAIRGGGEGNMTRFALQRREPLVVEWEQFLAAVRTGERPPISGWDGLAALSTALAMREASRTHQAVVPAYRELDPAVA